MNTKKWKNRGFTLIELIIVVAVLAILVGILAPSYTKYVKKSKVTKCEAQREEIERVYQIACIEDSALAACTDSDSLNSVTKNDTMHYLEEMGFFNKNEAKCPVYGDTYKLRLLKEEKGIRAKAICPCVDNVLSYVEIATKLWASNNYKGPNGTEIKNTDLIKQFYIDNGNTLPEVSVVLKTGSRFEDKNLYWRPYIIKGDKVILYATTDNNDTQGQWRGALIYDDGKVYQCSEEDANRKPPGTQIDPLKDATKETFEEWLVKHDFSLIS